MTNGEKLCREVVGDEGVTRFGELVGNDFFMNSDIQAVASAADDVRRFARQWSPHDGVQEDDRLLLPSLCTAKSRDEGTAGFLSFQFGANYVPLSHYLKKDSPYERMVAVNDQVVAELRGAHTRLYFECEISGAHPKQKEDLTMNTLLSYRAPGKPDRVAEFSVNLHAAGVMAKALACQNDVRIPTELPASVK